MRYYISDCHFFHGNLNAKMDNRGFATTEEMNEYMVKQWNSKVRRNDEVVVLGDFSFGNKEDTNEILKRLKGKIYYIRGNHDKRWLNKNEYAEQRFKWIKDYAKMSDSCRTVVLCHYPICEYDKMYNKDENGNYTTWMLFGHIHNTESNKYIDEYKKIVKSIARNTKDGPENVEVQMINCFCMRSDYVPLTLDEWIALDSKS